MQFLYGDKMPLRVLDEADFWKHQEAEHTVVIRALVPNLEEPFKDALAKWEASFSQMQGLVIRYLETLARMGHAVNPVFVQQVYGLTQQCLQQSERFIQFLNELEGQSKALQSNPTAVTVLHHIRRESEYFIGVAQTILYQR